MAFELILSIIDQTLKLANTVVESMTPDQKQAFLARHEQRMEWLQGVAEKLKPVDRTPASV
jgi:hypothetical protein